VNAAAEGFKGAFRTILTADTVSLLAAGLLYVLAVGPVKGFALSLGIATVLDIIVARTFTRRAAYIVAGTRLGAGGWFSVTAAAGEEST
jgi:preprotein translocase subunit SecD